MLPFFKKPYPYNPLSPKDIISGFFIGCFVAFFLWAFQPFGISVWETDYRFLKILGFGLVSFVCPLIFKLVLAIAFLRSKPEETWEVWKEIVALVFALLFIAVGNLVYGNLIGIVTFGVIHLLFAIIATFLLGLFPIVANVAIKYNRFLVLNQKEAQLLEQEVKDYQQRTNLNQDQLNQKLAATSLSQKEQATEILMQHINPEQKYKKNYPEPDELVLVAENEKDTLQFTAEDLLYIESADNYSEVVFLKKGILSKELIRSSLKRLESQIGFPYVIRCHRSYIVNLKQVSSITGNAQGYKIEFKMASTKQIAVSRSYGKALLERMETLG